MHFKQKNIFLDYKLLIYKYIFKKILFIYIKLINLSIE